LKIYKCNVCGFECHLEIYGSTGVFEPSVCCMVEYKTPKWDEMQPPNLENAMDIHVTTHENGSIGCGSQCKQCGGNSLSCGCH
jgi:hypothetical protein